MTLERRRAGAAVVILVALTASGITRGPSSAAPRQVRTGIPRMPEPLPGAVVSAPQFKTAVTLVKLDSCDPAVLAKAAPARAGMAEAAEQNRARAAMEQYGALLTAYAEGDAARSVDSLLGLGRPFRDRALMSINRRGADLHGLWDARRYALAVMLHTDAGLRVASDTYGADTYDQFQVAADVLQLGVRCAPEQMRFFAQRWYVAVSRLLRDRGGANAICTAEALLELGRTRLDTEPAIFFDSGLLAESFATIFALSWTDFMPSWSEGDSRALQRTVERRRTWLGDAATWLGRAAALEPGNDDVLLHLGRVQALLFDDAEALATLRTVIARTPSNDLAYLAAIFIGAVHDRQDRLDDAAAAYRAALERVRAGHAARVGLADVLRRSGHVDDARGVLEALVTERSNGTHEPMWWYLVEPPGAADRRLAALRAEVQR